MERRGGAEAVPQPAGQHAGEQQRQAAGQVEEAEGRAAQQRRRRVGHHRGQQTLRDAHVQAPQHHACEQRTPVRAAGQHQIASDQHQQAEHQQPAVRHAVRQLAERVRRQRIDRAHQHHHQRHPCHRHAALLRTQHQESFAEARQREHPADADHPPVVRIQQAQLRARDRVAAHLAGSRRGLAHADRQQQHRQHGGNHRDPEHRPEIVRPQQHQRHAEQRPEEGADRVERLAQAEGSAAHVGRRDVGHQRIAWRPADALADAVDQAGRDDQPDAAGHREQRLAERAERVAEQCQPLAATEVVAQRAREDLHDQRGGFGQALYHADHQRAGAEHAHHVERQQAVDHLGRDVHQQADEAQHPDARRQRRPFACALRHRPSRPGAGLNAPRRAVRS